MECGKWKSWVFGLTGKWDDLGQMLVGAEQLLGLRCGVDLYLLCRESLNQSLRMWFGVGFF